MMLIIYQQQFYLFLFFILVMDAFFAKKGIKLSRPTYQTNGDLLKSSQKNNNKKPIETISKYQINQSSNKSQKSHPNNNINRSFDIKPQISDTKDTRDTRNNMNMFNSNLSFMSSNQEPSNHHHANNHHSYAKKSYCPIQPKNIGFNTPISSTSKEPVFNLSQDKGPITSTAYKQRSGNLSSNSRQKITALPYKYQPYEVNKQTSAGYYSHNKQYHTTQSQKYKKAQNSHNKYESYKIEPDFNSYSTYGTQANLKDLQVNAKLNKQPEQTSSAPYIPYTHKTPKYSLQNSQISQKLKLMKQINQKSMKIRQLQTNLQSITKQSQSKVFRLQYQLRFLQESNKRLSQQSTQIKQRLVSQREKREKLQNQMNKQIFFKQDLKYAKDYDNLTERYQKLQNENTKMYNQHSKYILQMSQIRKNYEKQLKQLQEQYNKIKTQFRSSCLKIQKIMQAKSGEDKMTMIKLQSQINFIRKKNEQLLQTILQKQKESEQLHRELRHIRQQQKNEIISVQDQFNFTQIKQSMDQYQLRILRFQNIINEKDGLIQEQKNIIEGLHCQIRAGKKDNQIIHMKEKSYQNNLKNQIEMLKINMQNQTQIYSKKVRNIQDALQRKIKQNSQKDKFIKNFLLGRLKQLEGSHLDQVLQKIQTYFSYQCQQQMKRQLKLKQESQQKLMQERQQKLQQEMLRQEKLRKQKLKQQNQDKLKQQQQNKQNQILIQGQNLILQQQIRLQQYQQKHNETQIQHQRQQTYIIQQLQIQKIIEQQCQSYPNISQKEFPQQTLQNSPVEILTQQTQQLQKQPQQSKCQTIQLSQ